MKKVRKSEGLSKKERILCRAIKVWNLVYIEGYSYTVAWRRAYPVTKAKKHHWCKLAKKDCDLFEKFYG